MDVPNIGVGGQARAKAICIRLADKYHVDGNTMQGEGGLYYCFNYERLCDFSDHLATAVNLIIVPDLHQMNAGMYHHK